MLVIGEGSIISGASNLTGCVFRVNVDGTIDTSFGENGVAWIAGAQGNVTGIKLVANNKILIQYEKWPGTYLAKLNPNGILDTSFVISEVFNVGNIESTDMLVQADGKILSLAHINSTPFPWTVLVRRSHPDGTPDLSYGNQGTVFLDNIVFSFGYPNGVLDGNGKLLLTGYDGNQYSGFTAIRINTDGTLDASFGDDGLFFIALGNTQSTAHAESIAVKPDGTIYIVGSAPYPGTNNAVVTIMSLNSDGTPNNSFGVNGLNHIPLSGVFSAAKQIIVQSDGKILLAGRIKPNTTTDNFLLIRLNTNGVFDASFGDGGKLVLTPYSSQYKIRIFNDAQLTSNGKLVCAGWLHTTSNYFDQSPTATLLYRYLLDPSVKSEEPSLIFQEAKVSPMPISYQSNLSIEYNLIKEENVSIMLYDYIGKEIKTLRPAAWRPAGKQYEEINWPQGLPSGLYYIVLDNGLQSKPLKVMKI